MRFGVFSSFFVLKCSLFCITVLPASGMHAVQFTFWKHIKIQNERDWKGPLEIMQSNQPLPEQVLLEQVAKVFSDGGCIYSSYTESGSQHKRKIFFLFLLFCFIKGEDFLSLLKISLSVYWGKIHLFLCYFFLPCFLKSCVLNSCFFQLISYYLKRMVCDFFYPSTNVLIYTYGSPHWWSH